MESYTRFQCFLTVFILWFVNLGHSKQPMLGLFEGKVCNNNVGGFSNSICRKLEDCPIVRNQIEEQTIKPVLCSFEGNTRLPIVCCPLEHQKISPPEPKPHLADEMCRKYSELIYRKVMNPILLVDHDEYIKIQDCFEDISLMITSRDAHPKEFPYMVRLSYDVSPNFDVLEKCVGTLISERFVLTSAHCSTKEFPRKRNARNATWARIGDLDYLSDSEDAYPQNYEIIERIQHYYYRKTSYHHDIALLRLKNDVVFSPYVRPICLNTDKLLNPHKVIVTGWTQSDNGEQKYSNLLKVSLNTISAEKCNKNLLNLKNRNTTLSHGIRDEYSLCTDVDHEEDYTFYGDLGGPVQIKNENYKCMFTQIGITSFRGPVFGNNDSSAVYTRVSQYIPWIEKIVWAIN